MPRTKAIDGYEQDVVTSWRAVYCWTQRAGATSRVKRRIRRRERRMARTEIAAALDEVTP